MRFGNIPVVSTLLIALIATALAAVPPLVGAVGAAPGDLDPSFGFTPGDGIVTAPTGSAGLSDVAVDSSRRIIAVRRTGASLEMVQVVRYTELGALDPGFGSGGVATTDVGGTGETAAIAIDGSGRIIAAADDFSAAEVVVVRHLVDGTPDSTFDTDGVAGATVAGATGIAISGVVADSVGRVIVIGGAANGLDHFYFVMRFLSNGNLDASFGSGGFVVGTPTGSQFTEIAIDASDRIVIGGQTSTLFWTVRRLTTTGALDATFGSGGVVVGDLSPSLVFDVGVDAAGRVVALLYPGFVTRLTPSGAPDPTFGVSGGMYYLADFLGDPPYPGEGILAHHIAFDTVGRVIVSGALDIDLGGLTDFHPWARRLADDGTIDLSFGWPVLLGLGPEGGLAIATDGLARVILAGATSPNDPVVSRLLADGTLDPTFDSGPAQGFAVSSLSSGDDAAFGMAIEAGGRILAAGSSGADFGVAAYTADGLPDPTFGGGDGEVVKSLSAGSDTAKAIAVDGSGRLVVAGTVNNADFGVLRLLSDGIPDDAFSGDAMVVTSLGSADSAEDMLIDASGRIVVVGSADIGGPDDFGVVRYDAGGTLDATFDGDGIALTDFAGGNDHAFAVARDSSNRLVVVGSSGSSLAVARYNDNGSLDTTFDGDGKLTTPIFVSASARAVAIDASGRIVVAGALLGAGSSTDVFVVRYDSNGTLDSTFDGDGIVTTSINAGGAAEQALAVAIDGAGRIVVGGVTTASTNDFLVLRYLDGGSLDSTFGGGDGIVTTPIGAGNDVISAMALDSAGRIVCAGRSEQGTLDFAVARYLASDCGDGDIDAGEQCDDGNATAGDCCSPLCAFEAGGSVCRPSASACDAEETCTGSSAACPPDTGTGDSDGDGACDGLDNCPADPNPGQEDGDNDLLGDACDPCTDGAPATKPKLIMKNLLAPGGDDKLVLKASGVLPAALTLDPDQTALRVLIVDALGQIVLDATVPAGAFDPGTGEGWVLTGKGNKLSYSNPGTHPQAITKVTLKALASTPGLLKVLVKGSDGTYPVDVDNLPLQATVVLEPPVAATGQCIDLSFPGLPDTPTCESSSSGDRLKCK